MTYQKEVPMANLQKQFESFHKDIKVEKDELKEKRDILFNEIKESLQEQEKPVPELLNQGSYIYGVGIKPISDDQEYDIDVGLVFDIESDDYSAEDGYKAEKVRKWVLDAIKNHTKNVEEKGACIRVRYRAGYHVDLVCYASNDSQESENFNLAHKNWTWKPADPKALKKYIKDARKPFSDSNDSSGSDQLQRVVRYLKRWNDKAIPNESDDKPIGLALLLLCIEELKKPVFDSDDNLSDIEALRSVVISINSSRITVKKPPTKDEDVFGKISDEGMTNLIDRFAKLDEALEKAINEKSLEKACKILIEQFGEDFPLEEDHNDKQRKISAMDAAVKSGTAVIGPKLYGGDYSK